MDKMYSVKINKSGRYVRYCDDCWYEADTCDVGRFSKERAEEIAKQMRKHYVYDVTISNGDDTRVFGLKPAKPQATAEKPAGVKKNFKIKLRKNN
jgi:hypothetical protein